MGLRPTQLPASGRVAFVVLSTKGRTGAQTDKQKPNPPMLGFWGDF